MAAMASCQVATVPLPSTGGADSSAASQKNISDALTEGDRFELEQCRKIVQLRNEILTGKHPRIKLPPHLAAKVAVSAQKPSPPTLLPASQVYGSVDQRARQANPLAAGANAAAATPASGSAGSVASTPGLKAFTTGRTEIDPVLPEKSDHLIRAEFGLQRQKIERALREEAEQKRAVAQVGPPEELDVSDILAKATALVQATTAPSSTGAVYTANAAAERESSFDTNDYYSSNHETLDSHDSPARADRADASNVAKGDAQPGITHIVPIREEATSPQSRPVYPPNDVRTGHQLRTEPQSMPTYPVATPNLPSRPPSVGAADNRADGRTTQSGSDPRRPTRLQPLETSLASGEATRSDTSARMEVGQAWYDQGPGQQLAREAEYAATPQRGPPGLALAHNIAPIPQPVARTSPLIAEGRPPAHPAVTSADSNAPRGAPAQVAALRNEHQGPSSPESSSPHGKGPGRRKEKKKNKRKADRLGQDGAPAPYIKPEPRSPSPLSAPANIRPTKRRKQTQRPDAGVTYEQPQPQPLVPSRPDFYHISGPQAAERTPPQATHARYATGPPDGSPVYLGHHGYERVYHNDPQPTMPTLHRDYYVPQAQAPQGYPVHYAGEEYASTRSVSYREPSRYYQDDYSRPGPEPVMAGPQRPPLTRVMVDASGREYFEPHYPPPVRQSVAPSVRPGEPDVIYEGTAPIRHSVAPQLRPRDPDIIYERTGPAPAMPRRAAGPESYEEGGVIYRRASPPPFSAPRRVVTQPEYGAPDQMGYARAYSVRPMGPPMDEYAPPPDRRLVEGVPRQYTVRSASARPLEAVRYEMPAEGGGHMQGRPEGLPDYAGISRPQSRVEMMGPPVGREYAPRPAEAAGVQRSYSVRPVERYYGEPQPMGGEEVTYVERQPQHGVVYEPMREVYR